MTSDSFVPQTNINLSIRIKQIDDYEHLLCDVSVMIAVSCPFQFQLGLNYTALMKPAVWSMFFIISTPLFKTLLLVSLQYIRVKKEFRMFPLNLLYTIVSNKASSFLIIYSLAFNCVLIS